MSSAAPSKRQVEANSPRTGKRLLAYFKPVVQSTVGGKFLVALTGIALTLFVILHLIGNLKLFAGHDSINSYAQFLKDLGPLLWIMRIGLLACFLIHIYLAIRLTMRSREARPIPYVSKQTVQATTSSLIMLPTGLVILLFTLFHIAHYTLGWVQTVEVNGAQKSLLELHDATGRHDVFNMMIYGFKNPILSILYLIAQVALFMHLKHGVASIFQTLGANSPRWQGAIKYLAIAIALFVTVGNAFIVLAVWLGMVMPTV